MRETNKSRELFARAKEVLPGGVNSPVRAFGAVGGEPLFISRSDGAYIWDADGNRYIDYVASWGPMILGHNHPDIRAAVTAAARQGLSYGAPCLPELELSELAARLTGMEVIRMVSSGTEAVMSAIRLARGFTGRGKLVKFEGCYHGHSDSMLVKAGSGALTAGIPGSAGVTETAAGDTLTARYNDLDSVEALFDANKGEVAALIVEPVAANMGVIAPADGFLKGLRELCDANGALLIFDEVITGFRLALGGAREYFGVKADIATYGKIIGGGLPVGAYGGRREIMELLAPLGPVYQAGTLSGNPIAMAAGLAQLRLLERDSAALYPALDKAAERLASGLSGLAEKAGVPVSLNRVGSLCCAYFAAKPVASYEDALGSDTARFAAFFRAMLDCGVYLAPSQFEAMFIGAAHSSAVIDKTLEAAEAAFSAI